MISDKYGQLSILYFKSPLKDSSCGIPDKKMYSLKKRVHKSTRLKKTKMNNSDL
jgi:hypothetical protein